MKKSILIYLSMALCLSAKSQGTFTGFGIFKIGSDSSALFEYAQSKKIKLKTIESTKIQVQQYLHPKDNLFYKISDDDNKYSSFKKCPQESKYLISSYDVDGIAIKNIYLTYFKNKLEKVDFKYNEDVIGAIEAKYGKIDIRVMNDTAKCVYNLTGNERPLISTSYVKQFYFGKIQFFSQIGNYYDSECKQIAVSASSYEIYDPERSECETTFKNEKLNIDPAKLKNF